MEAATAIATKKADVYRSIFNAYVHPKNLHMSLVKHLFFISLLLLLFSLDVTASTAEASYYFFFYFVALFSPSLFLSGYVYVYFNFQSPFLSARTHSVRARVWKIYCVNVPEFLYALMKPFDTEAAITKI